MINCKPKCLAIPLIHNSAYLKYPQIETKYEQTSLELFFARAKFRNGTILSKMSSESFPTFG